METSPDIEQIKKTVRIPTSIVCALAGYTGLTLARRRKAGLMPNPVDKGREALYETRAVLNALGLNDGMEKTDGPSDDPWGSAANAIAQRKSAAIHDR